MRKTFGHDARSSRHDAVTLFNSLDRKFHFPLNQDKATMQALAIVAWMIRILETVEVGSLKECLLRVVIEQSRRGSNNRIIRGLAAGTIGLSDPIMNWIWLLLDQRMAELAEVPINDSSARGPPQGEPAA